MSSSASYSIQLLNTSIIYLYRYILPVIYVLGNIGNLLTALLFAKKSWRKKVCVFYFNIVLVSNTCFNNSTTLASIFISGFHINLQNSNLFLCKFYLYSAYLFSTLSFTTLILASIDRLLISSQNVDTRLYSSKRLAYFSISINTCVWCIFFIHILIKVSIEEVYTNYFLCFYDLSSSYYHFVSYFSLVFGCCVCVLMIILSIFAFKNVRRIRAVPQQQRQQIRTMTKKDFQLLRCLYAHDIVFIVFSIGSASFTVYQTATRNQTRTPLQSAIITFISNLGTFLRLIPYCASFYIFVAVSRSFRNELKRTIYKICGKGLVPIREEENKQENIFNVVTPVVS